MNDDAWLLVFKFFDYKDRFRCEQVSKRWKYLAYQSWKSTHEIHVDSCRMNLKAEYATDYVMRLIGWLSS